MVRMELRHCRMETQNQTLQKCMCVYVLLLRSSSTEACRVPSSHSHKACCKPCTPTIPCLSLGGAYKIYCTTIWGARFPANALMHLEISAAGLGHLLGRMTDSFGRCLLSHCVASGRGGAAVSTSPQRRRLAWGAPMHSRMRQQGRDQPLSPLRGSGSAGLGAPGPPRHAPGGQKQGGGRLCRTVLKQPSSSHVSTILCPMAQGP